MQRRAFLRAAGACVAAPLFSGCGALQQFTQSLPTATASVSMMQLAQAIEIQQCPEWCWAACISMIFAFYGHPLAQAEIVAQTYGGVICTAAQTTTTIGVDLSRKWIDDQGRPFTSQVISAYDPANGYLTLNNAQIVSELSGDHPLLFCNTQHAEVLYSVSYQGPATSPSIVDAEVIDPWPYSPRSHSLTIPEMTPNVVGGEMNFLAAVRVF